MIPTEDEKASWEELSNHPIAYFLKEFQVDNNQMLVELICRARKEKSQRDQLSLRLSRYLPSPLAFWIANYCWPVRWLPEVKLNE